MGDGAKENYRDRGPKNYRDCDTPQTNPSVPFLAELPRFENSRNLEMTSSGKFAPGVGLCAPQACSPQEELSRFDNSQNVKMIAPSVTLPRFRNSENVKTTALRH